MAQSTPPPFNLFGERLAELIKKTIKSQMAQADRRDTLGPKLTEMVEQQQQTNAQLGHLVTAVSQLHERVQENTQHVRHSATRPFWKKMALEVPPVVLAVLLAFGINSWWRGMKEQQRADLAVENIINEIERNARTLEENMRRNSARVPKLSASIEFLRKNPSDTASLQGQGIDNIELTEAAWQTVVISNTLASIDEELIIDAAEIYDIQLKRERRIDAYLNSFYARDPAFFGSLGSIELNREFIKSRLSGDEYLLKIYHQFLEKYDQPQPTSNKK